VNLPITEELHVLVLLINEVAERLERFGVALRTWERLGPITRRSMSATRLLSARFLS